MEERRLELESEVHVSGRVLIPIALTVGHPVIHGRRLTFAMCREAFGLILCDGDEPRVLLCDGRTMSIDELAAACPELREPLAAIRE